jgi:hypothetical protein
VYDIERIKSDPHYQARQNLITLDEDELGTRTIQNVVGLLARCVTQHLVWVITIQRFLLAGSV